MVQAALVTVGIGALLARNAGALSVLTVLGAVYLVWLGTGVARHPAPLTADEEAGGSSVRAGLRGAAVSGLNPKGLLLFFAILPQFVTSHAAWSTATQLAALGAFHVLACTCVYLLVAMYARRVLRSRPRAAQIIARTSGITMILVGVGITAERALGW